MTPSWRNHGIVVSIALLGLAFVGVGLLLARNSNPRRFSLDVADDRSIQLFAFSGFACTLAGIVLFLAAVAHTTEHMSARFRTNANIGVGIGFVSQLAGMSLAYATQPLPWIGYGLIVVSIPASIWGAMNYSEGKNFSRWLGLLAVGGTLGFIILVLLPHRQVKPATDTATLPSLDGGTEEFQ